jgi:hypothetical protein
MKYLPIGIDRFVINILCRAEKELSLDEIIAALGKTYNIDVPNRHNLVTRVSRLAKAKKIKRRKRKGSTDFQKQYYQAKKGQKLLDDNTVKMVKAGTVVKIKGKSFTLARETSIIAHPKIIKAIEDELACP